MTHPQIKKIALLPNVLTALGLTCGLYVIFRLNMTPSGSATEWLLIKTAGLLLFAAILDVLDGAIARALGATSAFGGFFDSMADAVSFGVAPSVIVLKSLSLETGSFASFVMMTSALVFSVCGVMRLVRFSVQGRCPSLKHNFTGLPIPAAGGAIVSLNLFLASGDAQALLTLDIWVKLWLLSFSLLLLGYLMVCRLKFPSFKSLHVKVQSFQLVFFIVVAGAVLFYGLVHHFAAVVFFLSWSYIFAALIVSLIRMVSGKNSKMFRDFEPEPSNFC